MVNVQRRQGIVCNIDQNLITVRIQQLSACTGCHAKDFCCSTDCAEHYVCVQAPRGADFEIGQSVIVEGDDRLGRLAVLLSFVLPILILIVSLALATLVLGVNELIAVLLALGTLGLYYLGLRLLDGRLRHIMRFRIHKLDQAS